MVGHVESAIEAVRAALMEPGDPIEVAFSLPRNSAEKILELLEAEGRAGAVVVPVKEQFTTTEAARMLGISRSTLMKLIDSGEIDSVKVASHHRIPAPAILRYEKARTESQHRTAKALEEFAHDAKEAFQNNVTFGKQS
ncbi:helix-turn-helix domain-containing protein [Paenarthrobacter ureafaciens]|jgi:excisionase family DNA binding protein|uniref:helix-turn-helix domain-containing protein n=2 Tax=Micrococcales TaxID=85006 RepID=UPI00140D43D4|nr:helix-turn-helix domain-containing protein [Paenarthrobacter ureafaciens]MCX8452825.1 excisionase family DNA-binding protein [Paenarthrobacter ureafaciens]MCY0971463.1 excisionase family DNA-binding protein [Paenarthrobacter ureafaciens]